MARIKFHLKIRSLNASRYSVLSGSKDLKLKGINDEKMDLSVLKEEITTQ
jgi:hypothetical protein